MLDPDTTALLPAVLDERCQNVPTPALSTRTRVAPRILEVAISGERSIDQLKDTDQDALSNAPTMWR